MAKHASGVLEIYTDASFDDLSKNKNGTSQAAFGFMMNVIPNIGKNKQSKKIICQTRKCYNSNEAEYFGMKFGFENAIRFCKSRHKRGLECPNKVKIYFDNQSAAVKLILEIHKFDITRNFLYTATRDEYCVYQDALIMEASASRNSKGVELSPYTEVEFEFIKVKSHYNRGNIFIDKAVHKLLVNTRTKLKPK